MKYLHCSLHNGRWIFRLSILGKLLNPNEHYDTAEDAAISADLTKHFLTSEFKLVLPPSIENSEHFSSLAYSRRGVNLSDSASVLKSLPEDVREFVEKHRASLIAHRESAPPETVASKFRRSDMIKLPAVRQWVEALELAELDANAFSAIDSASFFLRLSVVEKSLSTALKSLGLALRMHASLTNPKLANRVVKISELITHFQQNLDYVSALSESFKAEQSTVETAVETLENNRPTFS